MTDERKKKPLVIVLAIVTVASVGLGLVGYLRGAPPEDATRFYLRNDGGPVLFEHTRHGVAIGGCVDCHHELATDLRDCRECHDEQDLTPGGTSHDDLLAIHDRACDTCHEIAPRDEATSCRECHEGETAKIFHQSCNGCHLATQPTRFADEAGAARCSSCHLR